MSESQITIKNIYKEWFYSNPLLFAILSSHNLVENSSLNLPFRVGQKRIEYSKKVLDGLSKEKIELYLKIEIYRIILQHPYKRKPYNCKNAILTIASNLVIYFLIKRENPAMVEEIENLDLKGINFLKGQAAIFQNTENPLGEKYKNSEEEKFFKRNLQLDRKNNQLICQDSLDFEQWYYKILFLVKETASGLGLAYSQDYLNDGGEESQLWEEDDLACQEINQTIENQKDSGSFGENGGQEQRIIEEICDFAFDYKKVLTKFRQNIVSANRKLTRMRPSRRYGFNCMGSRYERKANILIAVDVSASITDQSFNNFYRAIHNFFFLGLIEKIDLIFFDVNLKNTKAITFKNKIDLKEIKGRGGTNFAPPLDFFTENKNTYSGMIIFTDGQADIPAIKGKNNNLLWILDSRKAYEKNGKLIENLTGSFVTYLPF